MEIQIYNNLGRVGVIDNYTSLIWTRRYFSPGSFEIHVAATDDNIEILQPDNLIIKSDDSEGGIIEDIELDNEDGKNEIVASGRFFTSFLDRRITSYGNNYTGVTWQLMVDIAKGLFKNSITKNPGYSSDCTGSDTNISIQYSYRNVLDMEEKLSKYSNTGFKVCHSTGGNLLMKTYIDNLFIKTYVGKDRSVNQSVNEPVIFTETYDNLHTAVYKYNSQNYKTCAIVAGEGEGTARTVVTVDLFPDESDKFSKRYLFVDAKDLTKGTMTDDEYKAILTQRGNEKLTEHNVSQSFEATVLTTGQYTYKADYDLGDIVTIRKNQWNIQVDKRITEIQEIYEHERFVIVPSFGDPLPQTIDWSE